MADHPTSRELLLEGSAALGRLDYIAAVDALTRAEEQEREVSGTESRAWLTVALRLTLACERADRLSDVEPLLSEAWEHWRDRLSPEQVEAVQLRCSHAAVLERVDGDLPAAEAAWIEAAELAVASHPDDAELLAQARIGLSRTQRARGRLLEAARTLEPQLKSDRERFGSRSIEYAETMSRIGELLVATGVGESRDAERLAHEALATFQRELGEGHLACARPLRALGLVYQGADRQEPADRFLRESWEILQGKLAPPHHGLGESALRLAQALRAWTRYEECAELLRLADECLGGAPHHRTAKARIAHERGALQLALDDPEAALPSLQRARGLLLDTVGPDHPYHVAWAVDLAEALRSRHDPPDDGALEEAERLIVQTLQDVDEWSSGAGDRIALMWKLSEVLMERERSERAEATLIEARDLALARQMRSQHMSVLSQLAHVRVMSDRLEEAVPPLEEALAEARDLYGDASPTAASMTLGLENLLDQLGRQTEADRLRERVVEAVPRMTRQDRETFAGDLVGYLGEARTRGRDEAQIDLLRLLQGICAERGDQEEVDTIDRRIDELKSQLRSAVRIETGESVDGTVLLSEDDERVTTQMLLVTRCTNAYGAGDHELVLRHLRLESRETSPQLILLFISCAIRTGRRDAAARASEGWAPWLADTDPWLGRLVGLLMGQEAPGEVVADAGSDVERCQALWCAGMRHVIDGRTVEALRALETAVEERAECMEWFLAQSELNKLVDPPGVTKAETYRELDDLDRELSALLDEGDLERATRIAQRRRRLAREGLGASHPAHAEAILGLAACYVRRELDDQADTLIARALGIFRDQLGVAHPDTRAYAEQVAYRWFEAFKAGEHLIVLRRAIPVLPFIEDDSAITAVLASLQQVRDEPESPDLVDRALEASVQRPALTALIRVATGRASLEEVEDRLETDRQRCQAALYRARHLRWSRWIDQALEAYEQCEAVDTDCPERSLAIEEASELRRTRAESPEADESRVARLLARAKGAVDQEPGECAGDRIEAARAEIEGQCEPATAEYIDGMVEVGDLFQQNGQPDRARSAFEAVALAYAEFGSDEDVNYAIILRRLIDPLFETGDPAAATEAARRAVEVTRSIVGLRHVNYLGALHDLAAVLRRHGNLIEAEDVFVECADATRSALGADHAKYARVLSSLSDVQLERGAVAAAVDARERAAVATAAAEGEKSVAHAVALQRLAKTMTSNGDPTGAAGRLEDAIEILAAAAEPDLGAHVSCLQDLARALSAGRRFDKAEDVARRALHMTSDSEGEASMRHAENLEVLASVLETLGRLAEALEARTQALELRTGASDAVADEPRLALAALALLHDRMEDYDAAEPLYARALGFERAADGRAP